MIGALIAGVLLAGTAQPQNPETADGFYCFTPEYFAYETLLHDSPQRHLLHVISLRGNPELLERTVAIPLGPTLGMHCGPSRVAVRDDTRAAGISLRVDPRDRPVVPDEVSPLPGSGPKWQTTRLWGSGSWSRSASHVRRLHQRADGSRVNLEVFRVSTGGDDCHVRVGSRLVSRSRNGREQRSRAIFRRQLTCRREGLTGGPKLDDCSPQPGRVLKRFSGRVDANKSYRREIAPFVFELIAEEKFGWRIRVTPVGDSRDLTSLLPLHGSSARDVQPPASQKPRGDFWRKHPFSFHPEARRTIVYSDDSTTMLVDDVRIDAYGRGRLTVTKYETAPASGGALQFRWIEFDVCLSFPAR